MGPVVIPSLPLPSLARCAQSALSEYGRQLQFWTERYQQLENSVAAATTPIRSPSPAGPGAAANAAAAAAASIGSYPELPSPGSAKAAAEAVARLQALTSRQELQVSEQAWPKNTLLSARVVVWIPPERR